MRDGTPAFAVFPVVGVALFAAGCGCLSTPRASAKAAALFARNWDSAATAMRAAAEARGAVLLPIEAREMELPVGCDLETHEPPPPGVDPFTCDSAFRTRTCAGSTDRGRTFVTRSIDGTTQLLVPIPSPGQDWRYTRLARRGNTLVILNPRIVLRRTVGSVRECYCSAGPSIITCQRVKAFVLDAVFTPQIEEVSVPIVEGIFDWSCKATLV
jgi:hypothetical protein